MNDIPEQSTINILDMTTSIVVAFVSNTHNHIQIGDVTDLIKSTHVALLGLSSGSASAVSAPVAEPAPEPKAPAVSIRKSIQPDYLICLEDGEKVKMLKRYLMTNFGLTPDQYREKWNLKPDYPMVAPAYSQKRRELAVAIGLGTKGRTPKSVVEAPAEAEAKGDVTKPARKTRGPNKAKTGDKAVATKRQPRAKKVEPAAEQRETADA